MYNNIGGKIKTLAFALFVVFTILSIIFAIALILSEYIVFRIFGLIFLFIGPFLAYISSFTLYGYGELVEKTSNIEELLKIVIEKPYNDFYEEETTPHTEESEFAKKEENSEFYNPIEK